MNNHQNEQPIIFFVDDEKRMQFYIAKIMRTVKLDVVFYNNAQEFLDNFQPKHPSCILLDQRLPEMTGFEVYKYLKEKNIFIPVIILTAHADVALTRQALQDGVFGFIEKGESKFVLVDCIQRAIKRDKELYEEEEKREEIRKRLNTLTEREYEVMMLMAMGKDRKEIAIKLDEISQKTVDNHRNKVLNKMKAQSPVDLVHLLYFCGVIPPPKEIICQK
jgi:FixJ family two-component response regulator